MRQRRAKTYKKLLHKYTLHFGFREPLQVLCDASFISTMAQYTITNPQARLASIVQTSKIKLFVTQCAIASLYRAETEAKTDDNRKLASAAIQLAQTMERRRCGHSVATPLHPSECTKVTLGPTNKHRYLVATNSPRLRAHLRTNVLAVPVLHTNETGVIVLEPMSDKTDKEIGRIEQAKLGGSRMRNFSTNQHSTATSSSSSSELDAAAAAVAAHIASIEGKSIEQVRQPVPAARPPLKKNPKGPKAPNPLSMKKKRSSSTTTDATTFGGNKKSVRGGGGGGGQGHASGSATGSHSPGQREVEAVPRSGRRKRGKGIHAGGSSGATTLSSEPGSVRSHAVANPMVTE